MKVTAFLRQFDRKRKVFTVVTFEKQRVSFSCFLLFSSTSVFRDGFISELHNDSLNTRNEKRKIRLPEKTEK